LAGSLLFSQPDWSNAAGTNRNGLGNESKSAENDKPDVQAAYGKLPLSFEVNQGQTNSQVKFLSRGNSYAVYLTATEATLQLRNVDFGVRSEKPGDSTANHPVRHQPAARNPQSTIVKMQLTGANPQAQAEGVQELPGKSNYFIGNDARRW